MAFCAFGNSGGPPSHPSLPGAKPLQKPKKLRRKCAVVQNIWKTAEAQKNSVLLRANRWQQENFKVVPSESFRFANSFPWALPGRALFDVVIVAKISNHLHTDPMGVLLA